MVAAIREVGKANSNNAVEFSLSSTMTNDVDGTKICVAVMGPKGGTFFNKADVLRAVLGEFHKRMYFGKPLPQWIAELVDIKPKKEPYGTKKGGMYKRSNTGKTVDQMMVTFVVPKDADMEEYVNTACKVLLKPFEHRTKNDIGSLILNYWKQDERYNGLTNWAETKFKGLAAKNLSAQLEHHFDSGFVHTYGMHLDRYLTDYDIKSFLEKHMGATSWEDVSEDVKRVCYKNYPGHQLPAWEDVMEEPI